jgi:ADP-ribosylglycohydrolase
MRRFVRKRCEMTAVFWVFFSSRLADGRRRTQREKRETRQKRKKRQHQHQKKKKKQNKTKQTDRQKYLYEVLYLSTHTS